MMMPVAWEGAEPAAVQDHTRVKNPAVPGEQAPPATPGQNSFGEPQPLLEFRTNDFCEFPFLQMIMNELRNHGYLSDSKRLELGIVRGSHRLGR
jgi:hypothetical protein